MIQADKIIKRGNKVGIYKVWCHNTTEEFHILKKSSMTPMKLLTNHSNIWSINIYDNLGGKELQATNNHQAHSMTNNWGGQPINQYKNIGSME